MEEDNTKYCVDCRYFRSGGSIRSSNQCAFRAKIARCVVTKEIHEAYLFRNPYAFREAGIDNCGPEAKFWEPIPIKAKAKPSFWSLLTSKL